MITMALNGAAAMCTLMLVLWVVHIALRNAGIVDAGWAGGLALLAIYYAIAGHGYLPRSALMAAMGWDSGD